MLDLLRKYKVAIVVGAVLLAAFIFYSLNLKNREHATSFERGVLDLVAPVSGVVGKMNGTVKGVWSNYIDLIEVRQENRQLRESIKILNSRLLETGEAVTANERLKMLLGLKKSLAAPTVAASVIGEDGSPWFKTILIDRGSADGLREGLPVVASDGVVGQLIKVAAGSSRVLLLTDHASGIAGTVQRSRARGVVKGLGRGRCSLEFALHEEDVKLGDIVVTSGIGQVFPKGLPVGEVTMVKKGDYGIFQTVEIRPKVNISHLEEVLVILQDQNQL